MVLAEAIKASKTRTSTPASSAEEEFFFLRIYGRSKTEVETFMAGLKRDYPIIQRYTITQLDTTMNPIVPTAKDTNWEARMYFTNKTNLEAIRGNQAVFLRYQAIATPDSLKPAATYHERKPGDTAFRM